MRFLRSALTALLAVAVGLAPAYAQTNYTTNITQTNLLAGGTPVANAKVCATAVDQVGNPITFSAPSWGLILANTPFCGAVSAGAITGGINVPDANHTNNPSPIHYNITIQLLASAGGAPTAPPIVLSNVPNVSGTTYSLDSYAPSTVAAIPANVIVAGPGAPGSCAGNSLDIDTTSMALYGCKSGAYTLLASTGFNLRGAWAASTAYALYDVFNYQGSSYVVTTAFTSGSTFSATNTMMLAAAGAAGPTTPAQLAAGSGAAVKDVYAALGATLHNRFSGSWTNGGLTCPDGNFHAGSPNYFWTSGYIYIADLATWQVNQTIGNTTYDPTYAIYDENLTTLACVVDGQPGGTIYNNVTGGFWLRFVANGVFTPSTAMLIDGSLTMPSTYLPYGYVYPDATFVAGLKQNIPTSANFNFQINQQVQALISASSPDVRNLFDSTKYQPAYQWDTTTSTLRNETGSFQGVSAPIPVIAGATYTVVTPAESGTTPGGGLFLDANLNPIWSTLHTGPFTANYTVTAPANAAYLAALMANANAAITMVVQGTTVPSYYIPFAQPPSTTQNRSPWSGKRLGVMGDSYSASFGNIWQLGVEAYHNLIPVFQDARAGRPVGGSSTNGIFECYGGTSTGTNVGASVSPGGGGYGNCAAANNGTVGNTLAQDIANVDLMIVEMGTNDVYGETLGTIADSASTASTYGYIKLALNGLLAARPQMRIVWVEPWQVGDSTVTNTTSGQTRAQQMPGVAAAIEAVCAQYGVPVVKMLSEAGLNSYNWSIFLNTDLIHPSALGWTKAWIPTVNLRLNNITPLN